MCWWDAVGVVFWCLLLCGRFVRVSFAVTSMHGKGSCTIPSGVVVVSTVGSGVDEAWQRLATRLVEHGGVLCEVLKLVLVCRVGIVLVCRQCWMVMVCVCVAVEHAHELGSIIDGGGRSQP